MRVLLVVCLLMGSISSLPVWQEQGAGDPGLTATSHIAPSLGSGRVESSGQGSSSSLPKLASPSYVASGGSYGAGAYDGSGGSYGAGAYGAGYVPGSSGSYAPAGAYDGSGGSYGAGYEAGSHGVGEGAGWTSGSTSYQAAGDQSSGPVFSDVSDLDPVYGFSSRSRYQRGRAVFAQSRYIPGEPLVQPMPQYIPVIKNPVMLNIPVQEPVKQFMPAKAPQQMPIQAQTQGSY